MRNSDDVDPTHSSSSKGLMEGCDGICDTAIAPLPLVNRGLNATPPCRQTQNCLFCCMQGPTTLAISSTFWGCCIPNRSLLVVSRQRSQRTLPIFLGGYPVSIDFLR